MQRGRGGPLPTSIVLSDTSRARYIAAAEEQSFRGLAHLAT